VDLYSAFIVVPHT